MVVALALVLTLAVAVLRVLAPNGADAPGVLLIVPVAICAMRFGIRGGIGAACVGMALAVATNLTMDTNQFTWLGYGTRASALFLVGALVGSFVDRGREARGRARPAPEPLARPDRDRRFRRPLHVGQRRLGHDARLLPGRAARAPADRPRAPRRPRGDDRRAAEARPARRGHAQLPQPLSPPRRLVPLAGVDDPPRRAHGLVLRHRPRRDDAQGGRGVAAPAAGAARDHPARDRRALAPRRDSRHDRQGRGEGARDARSSACA